MKTKRDKAVDYFKYPSRFTQTKKLFYIDNIESRYLFFSLHTILMVNGNKLNFETDIFNIVVLIRLKIAHIIIYCKIYCIYNL